MHVKISNHWYDCRERLRKQIKKHYFGGPFEGLPGQISEFAPSRSTYGRELYRRDLYRENLEAPFKLNTLDNSWETLINEAYINESI